MNLDWNFYYDSWLIDKVPDGVEIKVIEEDGKLVCVPESLTCYFGANPIYLYGEGKLWHESLFSPSGIAIYPSFLSRPGFEWIERKSFYVSFDEEYDFYGRNVVNLHTGKVNASQYLKNVIHKMYGIAPDSFANKRTPSTSSRKMDDNDFNLIADGVSNLQTFGSYDDMRNNGCQFFSRNYVYGEQDTVTELMSGQSLSIITNGAPILVPSIFDRTLFLKYSSIEIPHSIVNGMFGTEFTFTFKTNENFRVGRIFDFGSTHFAEPLINYGMSFEIHIDNISVVLNDGSLNRYTFYYEFDFRFAHTFLLTRHNDNLTLSIDGIQNNSYSMLGVGPVLFDAGRRNFISRLSEEEENSQSGDIEDVAIFDRMIDEVFIKSISEGIYPLVKKGGVSQLLAENIPFELSYGLTFSQPIDIYIPNYFWADFYKVYLKDINNTVIIATTDTEAVNSSYRDDLEPYQDKSILIPVGYTIDQALVRDDENTLAEEINVLTKLTSDVHIPLKIEMEFIVPTNFYDKGVVFNMALKLESLTQFIWYSYKKFKTGEFV